MNNDDSARSPSVVEFCNTPWDDGETAAAALDAVWAAMGTPEDLDVRALAQVARKFSTVGRKLAWLVVRFVAQETHPPEVDDPAELWDCLNEVLEGTVAQDGGTVWEDWCTNGILRETEIRNATADERDFVLTNVVGPTRYDVLCDLSSSGAPMTDEDIARLVAWEDHAREFRAWVNGEQLSDRTWEEVKECGARLLEWGATYSGFVGVFPDNGDFGADLLGMIREDEEDALIALEVFACFLPTIAEAEDAGRELGDYPSRGDAWQRLIRDGYVEGLDAVKHLVDYAHPSLADALILLNAECNAVKAYQQYYTLTQADLKMLASGAESDDVRAYCSGCLTETRNKREREGDDDEAGSSSSSSTKRSKPLPRA